MLSTLLIALLALNGLILGMCLFLLGARHWLASYGQVKIRVNDEKELLVQGGNSLLLSLVSQKIFIPSACGGRGTCGYCRVKVLEGGGSVLATEQMILTPAEIKEKKRLACQVRARHDLVVQVPEEFLAIKEFQTVVSKVEVMTDLIKKITFKLIDPKTIVFKPGQYVQVSLVRPGEEPIYRGYSIASSPFANDIIELNVRRVEGGVMSTYLHTLKEGDSMVLSGPYGEFFLQETTNRSVVCIAGGVGLAPMKSIIAYLTEKKIDRRVYLFYGARTLPLLYDHQVFVEMAKRNPNFRYIPALSDDTVGSEWNGHRGLITKVFQEVFPAGEPAEAYLCGPPVMIDALLPLLAAKGIQPNDIYYDKF
ncbi:MAG: Na(+)-translocating NADH-quinone reductase subunit F [Candidatus Ozemobacter sibiricus]|jgi:Na+-transporting NADH:ubiquinone oxidoreductase subunit F|uniref:Na(+)-translocating NADH-quinone reductase subunit F n=1 Tax=Candidatus Ozemobacter sibiricus TaxID=2268124 RepID=A0A367ZRI8_9BACT|nr:MAG: Na(+)-translocating NADH-quinone reductase subunit F [Candidatus Ozemobacter sibiricus]